MTKKIIQILLVVASLSAPLAQAGQKNNELDILEQLAENYQLQNLQEQNLAKHRRKLKNQRDVLDRTNERFIGISGASSAPFPESEETPTAEAGGGAAANARLGKVQ